MFCQRTELKWAPDAKTETLSLYSGRPFIWAHPPPHILPSNLTLTPNFPNLLLTPMGKIIATALLYVIMCHNIKCCCCN